jgi:hypothetical protein
MPLENIPFPNERVYKMKVKSERFYASDQGTVMHTQLLFTQPVSFGSSTHKGINEQPRCLTGHQRLEF